MRRIGSSVVLALATLASITGSELQTSGSISTSSPEDFLKSIQARKTELATNTSVPESEIVLYTELGRLQTELQAVAQSAVALFVEAPKDAQQRIAKFTQEINRANSDVSKIDCKDTAKYEAAADSFNRAIVAF